MTSLDFDLIDALAAEAATVPDAAVDRLRRIDYRPRTGRLTRLRVVGGLGASAAATAALVSAVMLSGATPAYAGWTADPSAGGTAPSAAVAERCASQLGSLPGPQHVWVPVVTDVRGPYTMVVDRAAQSRATCLSGPTLTAVSVTGSGGQLMVVGSSKGGPTDGKHLTTFGSGTARILTPSALAPIDRISQLTLSASGRGSYTVLDGHLRADITAVALTLADGSTVDATVADGWFLAWWPSTQTPTSATVTSSGGTTTQDLT